MLENLVQKNRGRKYLESGTLLELCRRRRRRRRRHRLVSLQNDDCRVFPAHLGRFCVALHDLNSETVKRSPMVASAMRRVRNVLAKF